MAQGDRRAPRPDEARSHRARPAPESASAAPHRSIRLSRSAKPSVAGSSSSDAKAGPFREPAFPSRLRKAFESLGPTYIKLGQILSAGEGIFPEELVAEFRLCRDEVPAESFEDVRRVVEEDLGKPLGAVFSEFATSAGRSRFDRAGAHRSPAHGRRGSREGSTSGHRLDGPPRPQSDELDLAEDDRTHPHRRPCQPAGHRRAVRGHHRRRARLPSRGPEHARHRDTSSRKPGNERWSVRARTRIS